MKLCSNPECLLCNPPSPLEAMQKELNHTKAMLMHYYGEVQVLRKEKERLMNELRNFVEVEDIYLCEKFIECLEADLTKQKGRAAMTTKRRIKDAQAYLRELKERR